MNASTPTPLRWTEEAEAAAVCTLAALEHEPQNNAAPAVVDRARAPAPRQSPLLSRLFGRLVAAIPQIKRDGDCRNGLF